jgi:hypothetical protein
MKLLIGNTGLIGTTLKDGIKFDYEFNSKNLEDLVTLDIDTSKAELYLCCLPATKWLVNKDPKADFDNILRILGIITQRKYKDIILYSTIDVYNGMPYGSNETSTIPVTEFNYGTNRYMFELLVKNTVEYTNLLILRLPALYGDHIKKNVIFDLLTKNQINKINYNSSYQWYNLKKLVKDSVNHIAITDRFRLINLFPEPVDTADLLKLFYVDKEEVDSKAAPVKYDYKIKLVPKGYIETKKEVLAQIEEFISEYHIRKANTRLAVCLFGEDRGLLNHLENWKRFSTKVNVDFYIALYSHKNVNETIKQFQDNLSVKGVFTIENDLEEFDKLKFKAKAPIYIHGIDLKATFSRITSQLFIRQKAVSLVDLNAYDAIMLSRSDISDFNVAVKDFYNAHMNPNLLIVNSGTHEHPGGGGGCTKCTMESKCELKYHANDICDYWCLGSPKVMKNWTTVYDNVLKLYRQIQKTMLPHRELTNVIFQERPERNEVILTVNGEDIDLVENYIHSYYPEKIMRVAFKEAQIIDATHDKSIWK